MSYTTTPDYTTLPAAMLETAKAHCRVTFNQDDTIIQEYLKWSIGYCEEFWGWQVFSASTVWKPVPPGKSWYQCPVQPVSDFKVVLADGTDVSAEYELRQASMTEPVYLVHKDGTAFPADAVVTLTAGFASPDTLPPPASADIYRLTATLYEYREHVQSFGLANVPGWLNAELTGLWIPRV